MAAVVSTPTPTGAATSSVSATPTRIPRRRAAVAYSPPNESVLDDETGTPGPTKARINHLTSQVTELVRKQHTTERKHRAEMLTVERRLEEREQQMLRMKIELSDVSKRATRAGAELGRCKHEGEGMREELNLHSVIQQQKAILAMSEEKLQVLELEQRLVQAEMARVVRDHKISLFVSREADLVAEATEREWRIAELEEELESANTSMAHQRAAEKATALASSSQEESRAAIVALEEKLAATEKKLAAAEAQNAKLEAQGAKERAEREGTEVEKDNQVAELQEKIVKLVEQKRALKEKLGDAKAEIEQLSSNTGDSSEAVAELRVQLRAAKSEASKQEAEAADALAELEISREREKALKAKFQDAHKEQIRLAGIEEELAALKAAPPKATRKKTPAAPVASDVEGSPPAKKKPGRPKKSASATASPAKEKPVSKARVRKTSPVDSGDEAEPKPKPKRTKKEKVEKKEEETTPLGESSADNTLPGSDDDVVPAADSTLPEKKKKRKLFGGAAPAFQWDPILNSGDGVIPTYLSPVKSARSAATIPRAGFSALSRQRF